MSNEGSAGLGPEPRRDAPEPLPRGLSHEPSRRYRRPVDASQVLTALRQPDRLYAPSEVLAGGDVVPRLPGVYGWYFSGLDCLVPVAECHEVQGRRLLYVGIAPSRPSSSATLRSRIRQHLKSNASGSTLRRTLGSLVAEGLGLQMRRVGKSERTHFAAGEALLSEWMGEHARVCWTVVAEPWTVEGTVVTSLDLPLNLEHNAGHGFRDELLRRRADQTGRARQLPVWSPAIGR